MRVFTALEIPPEGKNLLYRQTEPLRKAYPRLKWTGRDSLHITLEFFGELSDKKVEAAVEVLESAVFDMSSFCIVVRGIGAFPKKGPARVIFTEIRTGKQECEKLFRETAEAFKEIVPVRKMAYSPHITLARIRKGERWPSPGRNRTVPAGEICIKRIVLYQSVLERTGARYIKLAEKRLKTS